MGTYIDDDMGMEGVNLLVKGLRSSPIAKKRIRFSVFVIKFFISFSQVIAPLKEFCELDHLVLYLFIMIIMIMMMRLS